jgi:hypothetical protein
MLFSPEAHEVLADRTVERREGAGGHRVDRCRH